jgi:serine phosphatase RsbU (regulator of sigma subunit)
VLSSLAPLWQTVRTQPNEVLNEGVRSSAGARSRKLSHSLVVAEIALAFTLLSVSALFLSQLDQLNRVWPGFDPSHLLTLELSTTGPHSGNAKESFAIETRLLRALQAIPGVSSAAVANQLPLEGCCITTTLFPEGRTSSSDMDHTIAFVPASPNYFRTMSIPLERGRFLDEHDTHENPVSIVIDEAAAKRFWPNRDPLGAFGRLSSPDGDRVQVVGVVGNVRDERLDAATRPELYLLNALTSIDPMKFVVRSNLPPSSLIPAIRRAVHSVDPAQPVYNVHTMKQAESDSLVIQRIDSTVVGFFACAALLLASLAVYGLTSYSVRRRTVEMGTRMALGAAGRDLLRLIVGSGLQLAGYGIGIGALAVGFATWLVIRFFHIHDISALPYAYSVAVVAGLAMFASLFPGWRATLLSPMVAIRNDGRRYKSIIGASEDLESPAAFKPTLLTEFIDASRRSDSFYDVLRIALTSLCREVNAKSALLFENTSGQEYRCIASVPENTARSTIPANGFLLGRLRFYSSSLAFTPGDLDSALRWAAEERPQHVNEIEALRESRLRVAVALRTRDEIFGLLLVGPPVDRDAFSTADKRLFEACAGQFALIVENARLTERVVEQEKFRRDVALAAEVQKRLLPEKSPESATSSLGAFTLPVRSVGGDYYDFLNVGDHRLGIALADVAGKGIAAALVMAVVHASLRILAAEGNISLTELAAKMNRFLHRSTGSSSYATFFYAQLDEEKRQLHYVNAGHNPPYLVRSLPNPSSADGATAPIEELATGGMIIGMFPFANYEAATVDLHSGDVLLVFTDGVTEALNTKEEEFGEERLKDLLRRVAHLPVSEMTSLISQALRDWIGEAPQHDDLTFIVMKVN